MYAMSWYDLNFTFWPCHCDLWPTKFGTYFSYHKVLWIAATDYYMHFHINVTTILQFKTLQLHNFTNKYCHLAIALPDFDISSLPYYFLMHLGITYTVCGLFSVSHGVQRYLPVMCSHVWRYFSIYKMCLYLVIHFQVSKHMCYVTLIYHVTQNY